MAASYAEVILAIKESILAVVPTPIYLRAQNLHEANYQIPKTALTSNSVGIHANLPEIVNNGQSPQQGLFLQEWPIEVIFAKLISKDPTGEQVDTVLDEVKPLIDQFIDILIRRPEIDEANTILNYTTSAVETNRWTDDILTGWAIAVTIPISRTYICPPP